MKYYWSETKARGLNEFDLLVYRSNILGEDPSVTNWAGGNTSAKMLEEDYRKQKIRIMRVKSSGTDLRTITRAGLPGVQLEPVIELRSRKSMTDEEMVEYLAHTVVDLNAKRPSIDALIHAFIDRPHIDHMHPDAVIALCTARDGEKLMKQIYGDTAAWIPWLRPGFALAKKCGEIVDRNDRLKAILLGKHGLITWGSTSKECYDSTLSVIGAAQEYFEEAVKGKKIFGGPGTTSVKEDRRRDLLTRVLPAVRGQLSAGKRVVLTFDASSDVLEFVNSRRMSDLASKGAACPDHLVSTKLFPLVMEERAGGSEEKFLEGFTDRLGRYRRAYERYFRDHSDSGDTMYDPFPRIILIPGVGMVATGKDKASADITRDIYQRTISVIRNASTVSTYVSMTPAEAFSVEYWKLEQYKLSLLPPEKSLSRRVALVTGGASGIGRAIAQRFAEEGAHVVIADINTDAARKVADEIIAKAGKGRALPITMDVTKENDVVLGFAQAVLTYGGVDIVVSNAGISSANAIQNTTAEQFQRQMDILVRGYFLVAREGFRSMLKQGIGGSVIFVASKNALASGKNASVYSAAKAAELHFARCLAEEGGALKIRVNSVCPDAVLQGSSIWNSGWRKERAQAYGIAPDQLEEFYRNRTLLKESVYPADIAEAALFFATDRSAKTTGGVLTVDGGIAAGFVR